MSRLIYSAISSLDSYTEDMDGKFDWAAPDEEVLRFINDLERARDTLRALGLLHASETLHTMPAADPGS